MKESNFQFTQPVLTKLNFSINQDFEFSEEKQAGLEMETKVGIGKYDYNSENDTIVSLSLKIGEESSEFPFFIDTCIIAKFKWEKSFPKKQVDSLLSKNAPSLLLGYLRPIIANVTNSSPFPPYNIPFMNFIED